MIGSEELTEEQIGEHGKEFDEQVKALEHVALESIEARKFLNSPFGKAVWNAIAANKLAALKECATAKGADLNDAQMSYAVFEQVEQVFAIIIKGGDEAIMELDQLRIEA